MRGAWIGALAVGVLWSFTREAAAGTFGPSKPSDIVAVTVATTGPRAIPCNGFPGFAPSWVSRADGTISDYSPPAKSVFVLTRFAFSGSGAGASSTTNATLAVIDAANPPQAGEPSFTFAGSLADAGGAFSGEAVLPTGFVIKPPGLPCVAFPAGASGTAVLHGFFAKDK